MVDSSHSLKPLMDVNEEDFFSHYRLRGRDVSEKRSCQCFKSVPFWQRLEELLGEMIDVENIDRRYLPMKVKGDLVDER